MADIEKVRVGDKLHPYAEVVGVGASSIQIALDQNVIWLDKDFIESVEHIPVKRFKRGDWVRFVSKNNLLYGGLVVANVVSDLPGYSGIKVNWPDGSEAIYELYELEHDEAPE